MQRTFFLIAETAGGDFELRPESIVAGSTSEAIAALAATAGSARYGVWPYRRLSGDAPPEAPLDAEYGAQYRLLEQIDGASRPFVLTDTTVTSDTADASAEAISRGIDAGYRVGVFPIGSVTSSSAPQTAPAGAPETHDAQTDTETHAAA